MSLINKLKFIKKKLEGDDVYTFYFTRPKGLKHRAGQHGICILPGLYLPHPFTLSSSPDEKYVTITTHVNTGSRYKQKLMTMSRGDSILLFGPLFNFTFIEGVTEYVFLAQGIGITPFRSMLMYAHTKSLHVTTTLIHVDSKPHSFQKLTEQYATNASYPTNPEEFRAAVGSQKSSQHFYLSGSPRFVTSTKKLLLQQGVKPRSIHTDSFLGY